ncbi:phage tail assembly chaperone [Lachnoclostridium phytofermentans]|uniref:phage tail assembly chaperone n=1 Tax=Lachnoclostridium phytofermentans TaxID=66219 RepID=UPI000495AD32|nr:phage portal protein [Lachnoclostridium phytofermentans]
MENLQAFLAQNVVKVENIKVVVSKRFKDKEGKPVLWELTAVTNKEDEAIRKECMKRVPDGKGRTKTEMDYSVYLGKLAARCTVYPELDNTELQDSYGVMGADALLKTMLTPGEYADYLTKVQEVNGFDTSYEDLVEDAKN